MHHNQASGTTTPSNQPIGATIITGATGFVGGELLRKLLHESNRRLVCPVRAGSAEAAQERGADRLVELVGESAAADCRDRVRWIRADIEQPHLGWSDLTWQEIAIQTTEIFHCAASVSFDLPLDQAHRINVDGTKHVHELAVDAAALHGRFDRFHQVSTAYVAGLTKGRVTADYLPADRSNLYRNTYEQTKARAERFLRAQASSQVPVSIHRPSIIAGDSKTGRTTNWNVLYVPMKMVARGALPAFTRGGRELIDAVAIDVLVDAMVLFSQLDAKPLETHHLTAGPSAVRATYVVRTTADRAAEFGFTPSETRMLGPIAWALLNRAVRAGCRLPKRVGGLRTKARLARRCIDKCAVYIPYTQVDTVFDADRDYDLLRVFGVEMPPGPAYLETIMAYALKTDFGKTAEQAEVPVAA